VSEGRIGSRKEDDGVKELHGKVAFVTGSGSGIGRASARLLAERGAAVAVCDVNVSAAERVAEEISADGGRALALRADVSRLDEVESATSRATAALGRIDVVFSNAGILDQADFLEIDDERWQRMLAVHLGGTYHVFRAVLPQMLERKWGRLIATASIGAFTGGVRLAHYCAAKAGILGLTVALASEVARNGITVNAVAPGVIDTPMVGGTSERWRSGMMKAIPMRKLGQPEDIAHAVAYLASDEAAYVTGQALSPNGGLYVKWC
jgi:2-hydroxycyclohexanecarboxyl-CoA dehydrogenase